MRNALAMTAEGNLDQQPQTTEAELSRALGPLCQLLRDLAALKRGRQAQQGHVEAVGDQPERH
jgi:hypothetical protein